MGRDVFISHASEDFELSEAICRTLEAEGIQCWISPRDLLPGMEYAEAIVDAIGGSRLVVLVLTDRACRSPHVSREIERAVSKSIPILAFRLAGVELSPSMEYFLGQSHWLEADADDPQRQLPQLADAVSAWMRKLLPIHDSRDDAEQAEFENLLHAMWDVLDASLQDAFSLAYNKKRRERGPGQIRISTRDLFQALARIGDGTMQRLLADLPQGAMPEPVDGSIQEDDSVLDEEPLLSDCIAESLTSFQRMRSSGKPITPTDLFVDISKHGHGPSVSQLRQHGIGPAEIDQEVNALGLEVLRPR